MSSMWLFLVVSKLEMWLWKRLLLLLYSHPPFSCHRSRIRCGSIQSAWGGFYKYSLCTTLREYENVRYFQTRMEPSSEIPLYQNKLPCLVPEILNKTDTAAQETQGTAEMLFSPFSVQKAAVKAVLLFSCWLKAIHQAHVLHKLNNLAAFNNRCFRGILSSSSKHFSYLEQISFFLPSQKEILTQSIENIAVHWLKFILKKEARYSAKHPKVKLQSPACLTEGYLWPTIPRILLNFLISRVFSRTEHLLKGGRWTQIVFC